jgi:hypothetical protein
MLYQSKEIIIHSLQEGHKSVLILYFIRKVMMLNFRYLTDIIKLQVKKVTKIHCVGAEYFQANGHR